MKRDAIANANEIIENKSIWYIVVLFELQPVHTPKTRHKRTNIVLLFIVFFYKGIANSL